MMVDSVQCCRGSYHLGDLNFEQYYLAQNTPTKKKKKKRRERERKKERDNFIIRIIRK